MNGPIVQSSESLCEAFGLTAKRRHQRLTFLAFARSDHQLALKLQDEVITPDVKEIVDLFYDRLMADPESSRFIGSEHRLSHLKETQTGYLLTLGKEFDTEAYFESRLRAGLAHAWVGLPLTTYQCGYHILQNLILSFIKKRVTEEAFEPLLLFLLKIVSLDMSLAIEAYHSAQVEGLMHSLEKMKSRQQQLQERVRIDSLTRVFSRSQILENLTRCIKEARTRGESLSIVMLDIDHFKRINDRYGHQVGDLVLRQVARRFMMAVRDADMVGRFGGEEFLAILPGADRERAQQVAERIRAHTSSSPVKSDQQLIDVSVSGGVATLSQTDDLETLVARAVRALYQAKNAGRNRVIYLDSAEDGRGGSPLE